MKTIDLNKISKEIRLDNGDRIVLLDMLAADKSLSSASVERNIYRITDGGKIIWQVSVYEPVYERSPFTGIIFEDDGLLHAYHWDGTVSRVIFSATKSAMQAHDFSENSVFSRACRWAV